VGSAYGLGPTSFPGRASGPELISIKSDAPHGSKLSAYAEILVVMTFRGAVASLVLAAAVAFAAYAVRAQMPFDFPRFERLDELTETQLRRDYEESRRLFGRGLSDEAHGMMERESKRVRHALSFFIVVFLMLLVVFALPLLDREQVPGDDTDPQKPRSPSG
jgi:hypothetical protein